MTNRDKLLDWLKEKARFWDDCAHDTTDGHSPEADHRREVAWAGAAAYYNTMTFIEDELTDGWLILGPSPTHDQKA
jgi:hypothetical protein